MTHRTMLVAAVLLLGAAFAIGQQTDAAALRKINLHEAVELALKHNHVVRIASFKVEEQKQQRSCPERVLPVAQKQQCFHARD